METNNQNFESPSTTRVALRYGLIFGLFMSIYSIMIYALQNTNNWIGSIGLVISVVGLFMSMQEYRSKNEGFLNINQGLGLGMMFTGVSSMVSGLLSLLYLKIFGASYLDSLKQVARASMDKMEEQGKISSEQIDQAMEMTAFMFKPETLFLFGIFASLFIGFFLSLIVTLILRRSRPVF
jgi:Protein of unknown function (DUF4199)